MLAARHEGGEEVEFLRGHFGEAIEPETGDAEWKIRNAECGGGGVEDAIGIVELMFGQPVAIRTEEQGEVVKFVAELGRGF